MKAPNAYLPPELRADPYRYEQRVELRIVARGSCQEAGFLMKAGVNIIEVPESLVAEVEAKVEDSALIEAAKRACETADDAWEREGNKRGTSPNSWPKSFRMMMGRDPLPYDSVEVIKTDVPPPLTPEERRALAIQQAAEKASTGRRRGRRGKDNSPGDDGA